MQIELYSVFLFLKKNLYDIIKSMFNQILQMRKGIYNEMVFKFAP